MVPSPAHQCGGVGGQIHGKVKENERHTHTYWRRTEWYSIKIIVRHFRSWLPEGDDAADAEPCCAGYRGRMERGSKSQVSEAPRILVSVCMPPDDSAKRHHIQHMLAATCCNILHENHAVMGVGLAIRQSTFALLRLGIYPASPETGVIAFIRAQGLCV